MPGRARQMLALCPAAIAVHDDRDVPRQACQVQASQQLRLFRGYGSESAGISYGNSGMRFRRQNGFPGISLYAAKLTYASALAQCRKSPLMLSTGRRAALKNGRIG